MKIFKAIKHLFSGLVITSKYLGRHAVTLQYPEEKDTIPERSRGMVVLLSDKETGQLNCTGCQLCMRACPSGALLVDAPRDDNKQKWIKEFQLDIGLCCFCGLCEEACNFSALTMITDYEFSVRNRDELIWDVHRLQEVGKDAPYEDTRKVKKPAPLKPNTGKPKVPKKPEAEGKQAEPAAEPKQGSTEVKQASPAAEEKQASPAESEKRTESGTETGDG
jgi:NADH-quinone oxidoreductase subunit I